MLKKVFSFILVSFLLFSAPAKADNKEVRQWEDEVIYSLMVDRFYNGESKNDLDVNLNDLLSYQGGDFKGIMDRLDSLKDMKFTAIQLSPIFANEEGGYHGEWITDHYKTEEHFGTLDEFKQLVEEAHKRDMKILLEFPMNHVGKNHPWLVDPSKKDWFHEQKDAVATNPEDLETSNDLAHENPEVSKYLIDTAKWWIEETGIDGFNVGTLNYVPIEFWTELAAEVKAVNDDFYLTGTALEATHEEISSYLDAGFDGLADTSLNKPLRDAFAKTNVSMTPLFDMWIKNKETYERPEQMTAFFDNKDMERFTRDIVNQNEYPGARWKMALTYLYTQPEIPVIYYGTEIAVNGGLAPENRPLMNFRADEELMEYITDLGKVRQQQKALTRGSMELLYEAVEWSYLSGNMRTTQSLLQSIIRQWIKP